MNDLVRKGMGFWQLACAVMAGNLLTGVAVAVVCGIAWGIVILLSPWLGFEGGYLIWK